MLETVYAYIKDEFLDGYMLHIPTDVALVGTVGDFHLGTVISTENDCQEIEGLDEATFLMLEI